MAAAPGEHFLPSHPIKSNKVERIVNCSPLVWRLCLCPGVGGRVDVIGIPNVNPELGLCLRVS